MQLERLTLEGVGCFCDRIEIGPFDPGLNILAQPNEWGKSTVLRALTRALFDKYNSQAAEIKALQPAGSDLVPRVELIFRIGGTRYRLVKRFLEKAGCTLFRAANDDWERIAESDQADMRLRQLLDAPALAGRVAKPETWGLLRYLWAAQDDPADWPDWDGPTGEAARGRLVTVEIDATVRAVVAALRERSAELFTETGRVKKDGPLAIAEAAVQQFEDELAALTARRVALDETRNRYEQLTRELAALTAERQEKRAAADRLCNEAAALEKTVEEIARLTPDLERAREDLERLRRDEEVLAAIEKANLQATTDRGRQLAARDRLAEALPRHLEAVRHLEEKMQHSGSERRARGERAERLRAVLRLRTLAANAASLEVRRTRVHESQTELVRLQNEKARLPAVTAALVRKARDLENAARDLRSKLAALGLRVTLSPSSASEAKATIDGDSRTVPLPATLHANRAIQLELTGWGRLEIVSGSAETAELAVQLQRTEEDARRLLGEVGLENATEAEAQFARATELAREIKAAEAALRERLDTFEEVTACDVAFAQAQSAMERHATALAPTTEEAALSVAELESEEQKLHAAAKAAEKAEHELEQQTQSARKALETARGEQQDAERELARLDEALLRLGEQKTALAARHPGGLDSAKQAAQSAFVTVEARLGEAQRRLPEGHGKLRARSLRAAAAAGEVEAQHAARLAELERVRGALEASGAEGLYSRASEIEEQLERKRAEAARLRADGWAARLAAELLERRQTTAIQTVLGPLEDNLSRTFAELTGCPDRRVFFNAQLAVEGVGRTRADAVPFAALSRGAREQLLLALRAAIAQTCATDEPPCLILDDVLVHTDPVRQQNVLDFLQRLAARVQIVILTCHADRYRGAGCQPAVTRRASDL